jgi:transposase, IS30 family
MPKTDSYTHLTRDERVILGFQRSDNWNLAEIAECGGRHKGTISRELRRNGERDGAGELHYEGVQGHVDAQWRRKDAPRKTRMDHAPLAQYVKAKLAVQWSPQQISGRLKIDHPDDPRMRLSHECIYQWIERDRANGGISYKQLRQSSRKRRKRYGSASTAGKIEGRVGIEHRPAEVQLKARVGDWESDSVTGTHTRGPKLATHVERRTRYLVAAKLPDGTAASFNRGTIRAFKNLPSKLLLTMTTDNGREFAKFKDIERRLGLSVYFANPYHSWERGLNENTNGLLRQFFPRQTDFATVTSRAIAKAVRSLNNRPRKCLDYRTPAEVLGSLAGVALQV